MELEGGKRKKIGKKGRRGRREKGYVYVVLHLSKLQLLRMLEPTARVVTTSSFPYREVTSESMKSLGA